MSNIVIDAENGNNFSQAMKSILENYTDEVVDVIDEVLQEVGKDTADEMKSSASAIGGFKDRTGKYRKSWKSEHEEHRTYSSTVVYAKSPQSRLTHLLEFGHATRKGGRKTRAYTHIATINEKAQKNAVSKITKAIEGIK